MKLPNPFARDTASRIEATRRELAAAEATIAKMVQERAAAIADSDDVEAVRKLDALLDAEQRTTRILADRLAALEAQLGAESEQQRQKAYEAAVASIERLLPLRANAATEVQTSILALASAVRKYVEISGSIVSKWPTNVSRPSYHLGTRRLAETLRSTFSHPALIFASTKQPLSAPDLIQRACDSSRAEGFAAGQAEGHAELIDELRQRGAPPARTIDEEAA
jgi:hypothetical protein